MQSATAPRQPLADVAKLAGYSDPAAIESEPFSQWFIEDRFNTDRPLWEAGGATFTRDVLPYELMKLRMLNGSHTLLAYCGFLASKPHVRDCMADPALAKLIERHMIAAASTLADISQF